MDQNICYVPKSMNLPNVQQARPIEDILGCLVRKLYENGWFADPEVKLTQRIKSKLKEFDLKFVESIMVGVKKKV